MKSMILRISGTKKIKNVLILLDNLLFKNIKQISKKKYFLYISPSQSACIVHWLFSSPNFPLMKKDVNRDRQHATGRKYLKSFLQHVY